MDESFKSVIVLKNYKNSSFTMGPLRSIEKYKETFKGSEFWVLLALLALSTLIYDTGYFFRVGTLFFNIPTTLADHYRSSLECFALPFFLLLFFLHDKITAKNRKIRRKKYRSKKWKFVESIIFSLLCFSLFLLFEFYPKALPLFEFPYAGSIIAGFLLSAPCIASFNADRYRRAAKSIRIKYGWEKIVLVRNTMALVIFFFTYGFHQASSTILRCHYNIGIEKFYTKDDASKNKCAVKTIEKGIIAYNNKTQEIEFHPWEEVSRIIYPYKSKHGLGLFIQFWKPGNDLDRRLLSADL